MAGEIQEILVAPVASMIAEVGGAVAQASVALSQAQVAAYQAVPQPLLDAGVIPSFFHMQAVEVELKLSLQIERKEEGSAKWRLFGRTENAAALASGRTLTEGSSRLKLTFAPGPAPMPIERGIIG